MQNGRPGRLGIGNHQIGRPDIHRRLVCIVSLPAETIAILVQRIAYPVRDIRPDDHGVDAGLHLANEKDGKLSMRCVRYDINDGPPQVQAIRISKNLDVLICEGLRGHGLIKDKCQLRKRRQGFHLGYLSNDPGWCPVNGKPSLVGQAALPLEIGQGPVGKGIYIHIFSLGPCQVELDGPTVDDRHAFGDDGRILER